MAACQRRSENSPMLSLGPMPGRLVQSDVRRQPGSTRSARNACASSTTSAPRTSVSPRRKRRSTRCVALWPYTVCGGSMLTAEQERSENGRADDGEGDGGFHGPTVQQNEHEEKDQPRLPARDGGAEE